MNAPSGQNSNESTGASQGFNELKGKDIMKNRNDKVQNKFQVACNEMKNVMGGLEMNVVTA